MVEVEDRGGEFHGKSLASLRASFPLLEELEELDFLNQQLLNCQHCEQLLNCQHCEGYFLCFHGFLIFFSYLIVGFLRQRVG